MEIKFEYNKITNYHASSQIQIDGERIWTIDEENFGIYYDEYEEVLEGSNPYEKLISCIEKYFWENLDLDPDNFVFDEDDINTLYKYVTYEEI